MKTAVLTMTAFMLSALPGVAQSLPSATSASIFAQGTAAITQKEAGLEFEGFGTPNVGTIVDTVYHGECPGEKQGNLKARFYSTATPPAPGRRVVVRNVSRGLTGDTAPFTDRDYSKGNASETTSVELATKHQLTHFSMLEGTNNLEYEIKQSDSTVVERGSFTAQLSRDEKSRTRNAICSDEKYCRDSENTPLDKCENVSTRSRCYCPDTPNETFLRR